MLNSSAYSRSAACVAAALYEHALTVSCLAGNPSLANALEAVPNGDIPWKPKRLAQMFADRYFMNNGAEREQVWREVYGAYQWLCKVKHPTLRSAIYDSGGTKVGDDAYVVMAAPDIREDDLVVKATIATISISRMLAATNSFADALRVDETEGRATFAAAPMVRPGIEGTFKTMSKKHLRGRYRPPTRPWSGGSTLPVALHDLQSPANRDRKSSTDARSLNRSCPLSG
jgi:hypothetical protein